METTKTSYQADTKDSSKMNNVEPLQLHDDPKAHKKTTPELQLAKAKSNTESVTEAKTEAETKAKTEAGTTNRVVPSLGKTTDRGAVITGTQFPLAERMKVTAAQLPEDPKKLNLDATETKITAEVHKMVPPFSTTKGRGANYHGNPANPLRR